MTDADLASETPGQSADRLGWRTFVVLTAFYLVCLSVATFPFVLNFRTSLPGSLPDPLQHLWVMKWYKTCLIEGRSPLLCPEIQYPIGAPLGNFSPLQFQALLYLPLSTLISNDVLCFNLIWTFGMVTTGLGTFLLAWQAVRDRRCAAFAGMVAMLSTPMMMHGRAHLEIIHLGAFPIFLVAWIRFIDQPSRGRLAMAALTYLLVALCAAYYGAFAVVPATLYLAWKAIREGRSGAIRFLSTRAGWLLGFAMIVGPFLSLAFAPQIWATWKGYSLPRPMAVFEIYGTPLWTFLAPTALHRIHAILPFDFYEAAGHSTTVGERASYLGVVSLFLIYRAAADRASLRRSSFFWVALGLLAILACGASVAIGPWKIPMPAALLKTYVPGFQMVRIPARFNLFAAVVASVLAAAGLKRLLDRIQSMPGQAIVFTLLTLLALADLSMIHNDPVTIPPLPRAYEALRKIDPKARFVDIPQDPTGDLGLSSTCAYWQSQHRMTTTAGYSGQSNAPFDALMIQNSPFTSREMANPRFLAVSSSIRFDIVNRADFRDYAWLYLTANQLDFAVLHKDSRVLDVPCHFGRLLAIWSSAIVIEDDETTVFARSKLEPPAHPVILPTSGWRTANWDGKPSRIAERVAHLLAYNPDADRRLIFGFEAKGFGGTRLVRLMSGPTELARWEVPSGKSSLQLTPPIQLPAGLVKLTLESDREVRPRREREQATEADAAPYSLRVSSVALVPADQADDRPSESIARGPGVAR